MSQSTNAPMPTLETQKKIVDAYLAAFKKTPLLMLIGGGSMLKHATQHGTGWRADCLGDMGGFWKNWCHMRIAYPKMLPAADAVDAWKTAPVAWETCWDMRKWVDEGWPLRFIFNYALALHGSVVNTKSAPSPEGENPRPEDMWVNIAKEKKLTNIRAAGSDEALRIVPPRQFGLEQAMEFINDDELVEVTPAAIRLRKVASK